MLRELAWRVPEIAPSLVNALIDAMGPCFPDHIRGTRPIHSKGVGVAGDFVASHCAAEYCTAAQFSGSSVPVTVRFSNGNGRSEEHTSELQSRRDLVCRLLLEKKKKKEERTYQNRSE